MNIEQPKHVFISYVRENQDQVDRLAADLTKAGVNVWLDRTSIKPGARWKDAIREAIRQGDFFIACFSKEYTAKTKNYMNEELTLAIEELRKYASDRAWFIPVLLSECDVPAQSIGASETLHDINRVLLHQDWSAGIQRILSVIKPIPVRIQNLINALHSEDAVVRQAAAEALGNIGPEAKAAVPALIDVLNDEDAGVCFESEGALVKIGSKAVPMLVEALEYKNISARTFDILGKIGIEAVPSLIGVLKGSSPSDSLDAASTLVGIAQDVKDKHTVVLALIEALNGKSRWVHENVEWALEEINTSEAIPALIEVLKHCDESICLIAERVLGNIGAKTKTDVLALTKAIKDENKFVSRAAIFALMNIDPKTKEQLFAEPEIRTVVVPALVEALEHEDNFVRDAAFQALEKINTPEAKKVLKKFRTINEKLLPWFLKSNQKT